MGLVHAFKVLVATEDYDFVIDSPVCFGSLEALDRVMQCSIRWIELEVVVGHDLWLLPTTIVQVIVAHKHMVGHHTTKGILMLRAWLRFEI